MSASSARRATFVLADISGYTRFLSDVGTAHGAQLEMGETPPAYPLMTSFLDAIVRSLTPPFVLAKLEGDAVFAYADDPDVTTAHRMLKNDVVATTGWPAYALLSSAAVEYLGVSARDGVPLELAYEHTAPMRAMALPLRADDRPAAD